MDLKNIKAYIFDIDGTLLDTLASIAYVGNQVLAAYGYAALPVDNYRYYAGNGGDVLTKKILTDAGDTQLVHYEEGRALYRRIFAENSTYQVKIFDGLLEVLRRLKEQGMKLGVCSNKPILAAEAAIASMFPDHFFEGIESQREGMPVKPDPAMALALADQFGVLPAECVYVGDTCTDMQTGKNAGMYTVGVTWGFRPVEELQDNHADQIIDRPEELLFGEQR